MSKKKSAPVKRSNSKAMMPVKAGESQVDNSLGGAVGFGGPGIGIGGNAPFQEGFPGSEQISQTNTLFKNLRWYLVSNMRQPLSEAYVELGLIQTVVDVPVDDGLRGGIEISSKQLDEKQIQELQVAQDRDDDMNTASLAMKWTRLYGGAGILVLTSQDPETPLEMDQIQGDDALEFRAVDMWELFWDKQNTEGYDPTTQLENFEYYNYYGEKVHKSRVMPLKGMTPPSFIRPRLRGWGFSVVEVLIRSINQYLKATDLGFEVLDEFKLDIYKIKNLTTTLLTPGGEDRVRKRLSIANFQKNYQNGIMLDSEDDYASKQLSFAGLAEAMAGIRMQVASDMRMPITKLFGTSTSAGFSTDQNDMENYNSMVESQVRNKIKYPLLRMLEIKCQKLFGFVPEDLAIKFKPLRELTAEQEENVKTQKFNRAQTARSSGLISQLDWMNIMNRDNLLGIQLDTQAEEMNQDAMDAGELDPTTPGNPDDGDSAVKDEANQGKDDNQDPGAQRLDSRRPYASGIGGAPKGNVKHQNSGFDSAAYDVDGGKEQFNPQWHEWFANPQSPPPEVDKGLWGRAVTASEKERGKYEWEFALWKYKQLGGVFR